MGEPDPREPLGGAHLDREEVEALLETRRELGPAYDKELVDAFADRIDRAVQQRSGQAATLTTFSERATEEASRRQLVLGIVSLGAGVPLTAVAGVFADLPGIALAWFGIAAVNAAHASQVNGIRRFQRLR